jgi:hypothetical protein
MNNFMVDVKSNEVDYQFEVAEFPHHSGESCKFRAFKDGKFVASFEPDNHQYLHVCQNPTNLSEAVLHLLAEKIEAHHPHEVISEEKINGHEKSIQK